MAESFDNLSPEVQISSSAPQSDQSSTSSQADVRERQQLTFDDDLWDQLPEIQNYHKQGTQILSGLQTFAFKYSRLLKKFSYGLKKCAETLIIEASPDNKDIKSDNHFSTLKVALGSIKNGVEGLANGVDRQMQEILGSLVEPLDTFQKHYTNDTADSFTKCQNFMTKYKDLMAKQIEARDRYFFLKDKAHHHDNQMEEAMQAH